ncbi:MAG: PhnD/SsuA/transferrin family substrate-binding protein [Clostridiales Family XIII bacterium]|jgi:phosphonate transport system substrate-binding protein|nr:PhnD/SsuA/transferrin family substrate-binding protein [Clostridiales Family XIII bacterium]
MRKRTIPGTITALLLALVMAAGLAGCTSATQGDSSAQSGETEVSDSQESTPEPEVNTSPINVVWYPNESSNTHEDIRAEVGRLIEQATGRAVEHKLTTDYTIAIESIASGSADIAMSMGAVGYIEAKNKNPLIDVLFVNADKEGKLDGAKYFSWICVNTADADAYKSGDAYSIDNIKGKKMSFVSNSSTSGFRVPTTSIIEHFASDNLDEDKLIEGGPDQFFGEVYFGGSHQGSAVNLIGGNADVAAFCDIELAPYIQLKEGAENTVGAVYEVKDGADAPFDVHAGKDFVVIACTPVFNGPNAYNPENLSPDEIKAIQDLFTSPEVANNELIFYDADVEGALGLYKKSSSYGYVLTSDSWYDPYRK